MKRRLLSLLAVMAGIGLLLVWVAGARGPASAAPPVRAGGLGAWGVTADITTTSYFTTYLPLVQRTVPPCSGTPVLLSPADNGQLATLVPELTYMRGSLPVSQTVLEIADNAGFADPLRYWTTGSGIGPLELKLFDNLQPGTVYYWRVQDTCDVTQSPMSAVWSFTTGSNGVILPAPSLVSPADGATGLVAPVTLTWNAVAGATGYRAIRCVGTGCTLSFRTEALWAISTISNTAYTWYVTAYNDYAYGSTSEIWTFATGSFTSLSTEAAEAGITVSLEGSGIVERRSR